MRYVPILLTLFACAIWSAPVRAKDAPKAQVQLHIASTKDPATIWVLFHFTIADDWHIYWQNPGDSGIAPSVTWQLPDGINAGPLHWPAPERIAYSGLYNYGYGSKITLPAPLTLNTPAATPITLHATLNWLVCKDICIPESQEVSAEYVPNQDSKEATQQLDAAMATVPTPFDGDAQFERNADGVVIRFAIPSGITDASQLRSVWWFPVDDGILANDSDQRWQVVNGDIEIRAAAGSANLKSPIRGHVVIERNDNQPTMHLLVSAENVAASESTTTPSKEDASAAHPASTQAAQPPAPDGGLLAALMAAFLGGIILNVMPCVLPILSLKALSITVSAQHSARRTRLDGILYAAGVLVCFIIVATALISLQQAGKVIGWGFQLQSPHFVVAMCYMIFLVALNLSGIFSLPSLFGNLSHTLGARGELSGAFFTGVLAALVATPCSAPFMATGIGYALGQPPMVALAVFVALGIGMAFPYTVICFVPGLRRLLPKPGAWMERLRQLLAFPMYATSAWLLWVLVQQSGPAGLAEALFGLCVIGFGVWAIPLFANNPLVRTMLLVVLAGLLIRTAEQQELAKGFVPVQQSERTDYFTPEKLQSLLEDGKPVFVDVTAAWCLTCKVNERVAVGTDMVQQAMRERNIMTLVADWTNRDDAITRYLASFGRNGVPLYVYYAPGRDPVVLPQVLTPELLLGYFNATASSQ